MFERFTEQARDVVGVAQEEAHLMHHAHVGTEHLLVALARSGDDEAAALLHRHGLTGERTRAEVVRMVGMGSTTTAGRSRSRRRRTTLSRTRSARRCGWVTSAPTPATQRQAAHELALRDPAGEQQ